LTYRADPPEGLRIVRLDSLTAIYHRASGQTHVVVEPVPAILAALSATPLSLEQLLAGLGVMDDAVTRALLGERLNELLETGLVSQS
jgi:PqqD family protein of HPr-rel-A system